MRGVGFASKFLREIRIAFPVGIFIAIGQTREAGISGAVVAREAAMRQPVAIGIVDRLAEVRRSSEITLSLGIAPGAFRIPVPRLHQQLCVLTIADGLPSGRESLRENGLSQQGINRFRGNAVDTCPEGFGRNELIDGVAGSDIDVDGLRKDWKLQGYE